MNSTIKKQWIDALRSGEYPQTSGMLHNETGFCCLGVLCDLYLKEQNQEWVYHPDNLFYSIEDSDAILPFNVSAWAHLSELDPYIHEEGQKQFLTHLNDNGYELPRH